MAEESTRSIAYICPKCGQSVILERSVFQLAAAPNQLPCPCGGSMIEIEMMGDHVRLTVPCRYCDRDHTVTCSTHAFLHEPALAFSCSASRLDCCYVGEADRVYDAMCRLEESVDRLELGKSAEEQSGTFLDDIVMEEVLGELKEIAQRGGISCTCGSRTYSIRVGYSAVELICGECGGALRIPAATMSDLDDICCKPVLQIRGQKEG